MSIALLIEEVRRVGGELSLRDGELRIKAPKGAITPDMQARLKASKEALIAVLTSMQGGAAPVTFEPLVAKALDEAVPLSHAQQRLWFMEQLSPGTPFLNLPGCLRIRGALDVGALTWAVRELGARHDALRAAIVNVEGEPRQVVQDVALALETQDFSALPEAERAAAVDRACAEAARTPLPSSMAPQIRFILFKASAEEHALLFVASHLIFDGSSRDLVFRDLRLLYEARVKNVAPPPAPKHRFRDLAAWHRAWIEREPPHADAAYWKKALAGMPPTIDLPTDQARPSAMTYAGRHESFELDAPLVARLRDVAQKHRATFSMVALAAAEVVLARYSGQTDFGVGMPVSGRVRPEAEDVVGMFVNTLVMRSVLREGDGGTFADLLGRVRDTTLDALQYQNLPFDQLVQIAQPARERGRTPLFQAMFSHQRIMTHASGAGLVLEDVPVFASTAATDITFWLFEYDQHVSAAIETASDLFGADATKRYARSFRRVLEAVADNAALPLDQIPILAEEDERHLLFTLNETRAPWEETALVHRLFERAVDARPGHRALLFEEQRVDYGELDARANQLAHVLRARGVTKDSRVGVFLRRGPDLVVALLAVHKAGGGYVPLDPMFPADRVEYVLADCGAQALITTSELASRLATHPDLVLFDRDAELIASQPRERLDERTAPDGLAYVIYTSGSTGRPKGVMVEHRNVVSFFAGMERAIGLNREGTWLSATTVAFDISVLEILGSLTHGRTVILLGETVLGEIDDERYGIPGLVRRHGVTHFQCTPTQCRILLLDEEGRRTLGSLQQLVVGGEAVPQDLADELTSLVKGEVINAYGPTETTVWSTTARLRYGDRVTIGRPIANTITFVVDAQLRPVPLGAIGELCIGGPGVTRGYLGREELTAEKFVPNKLRPDVGGRLYRTGDLVKHAGDGKIVYLGRNDHQVKIRGFRIELGEIETLFRKVGGVSDVAVVAQGEGGEKRLVAYVVTSDAYPGDANVRTELRANVPEYMVPGVFVHLDALPLTPNGKLDRKALPEPGASTAEASTYVPPANDIERVLCEVWSRVLRAPQISATSDFFALGGHSLLAVQIFNAIEKEFDVRLPMATLFERPTVRLLAERLRELTEARTGDGPVSGGWTTVVPIRPGGKLPPFFCVAGIGGNPMNLIHFAKALGEEQPFYGLQHRGVDGALSPHRTIEAMAEEMVHDIRKVQRSGPYYIGGFSAGGLAAYEIARMLLAAGEEVGLVVLLDTSNPSIMQWGLRERIAAHLKNLKRMGPRYISTRAVAMAQRHYETTRRTIRARLGAKYRYEYRVDEVTEAMVAAEAAYVARDLQADVLLIQADSVVPAVAGVGYPSHESNGWRGLVRGRLDIVGIKSQHLDLVTELIAPRTGTAVWDALVAARARIAPISQPPRSVRVPQVAAVAER